MRPTQVLSNVLVALVLAAMAGPTAAQGFKFSQPDDSDRAEAEARQAKIADQLSTPCKAALRDRKIMVLIGQRQSNGFIVAQQQNYGPHFQAINTRLRALGLKTYTSEEIRRQIAQAEIDAYFRNDPDAALNASKKYGASFILRGLISSQASMNPIIPVNQVVVDMDFTLTGADGRVISDTHANSGSYAGADIQHMALTLVNEQADEVVAKLYSDYCRNAGFAGGNRSQPK